MREMVRHEMKSLPQRPPKNPLGHAAYLTEPQKEDFLPSRIRPPLGPKLRSAQPGLERICHMVDIAGAQPGIIQAETDRMLGELVRVVDVRFLAVLDAVEPFLLGSGDERAVDEHRSGGLVIYGVDSENVHRWAATPPLPECRLRLIPRAAARAPPAATRLPRRRACDELAPFYRFPMHFVSTQAIKTGKSVERNGGAYRMRPHIPLAGRWNARSASEGVARPPPRIFAQS